MPESTPTVFAMVGGDGGRPGGCRSDGSPFALKGRRNYDEALRGQPARGSHCGGTGGAINAHIPFDITVDTTYNRTTDTLDIHTGATLESGGGFTTTGPEGNFSLGALLDFALKVDLIDPTGIFDPTNLLDFSTPSNVVSGSLVAFSSTSPDLPITLADTPFGSIKVDWPHLSTTSTTPSGDMISGSGASNNIVNFTADLDALAAHFFPIFQPVEEFIGPDITDDDPESTFQWLDVKADLTANLLQNFLLKVLGLNGKLTFEDGTTQQIVLGGPDILVKHASSLEGGDPNKTNARTGTPPPFSAPTCSRSRGRPARPSSLFT